MSGISTANKYIPAPGGSGPATGVQSVEGGDYIVVDNTDPANPVVNNDGVQSVRAGAGIELDGTDTNHRPIITNTGVQSIQSGAGIFVDSGDPQNPTVYNTEPPWPGSYQQYTLDQNLYWVPLPGSGSSFNPSPFNYMLTAAAAIVGDLDIRIYITLPDWTPTAVAPLLDSTQDDPEGYALSILTTGHVRLTYATGGVLVNADSTAAAPYVDGGWLRAVLDVDNGAAGHDVLFYTSADGVNWVQLGATVTTAGVIALDPTTHPNRAGIAGTVTQTAMAGRIFYVEIRDGIDGPNTVPTSFSGWGEIGNPPVQNPGGFNPGDQMWVQLIQDATGNRVPVYRPGLIAWPAGIPPVATATPGALDVLSLIGLATWVGQVALDVRPAT